MIKKIKGTTRSSDWMLKLDKFGLEIRGMFLNSEVINHCNNLPMDVVDSPSLTFVNRELNAFKKKSSSSTIRCGNDAGITG